MKPLEKRIEALERWYPSEPPVVDLSLMERSRRAGNALRKVAEQPDATDEQRRRGGDMARLLRKYPVTTNQDEPMPSPVIEAEPALPKHAYICIEEGEIERSGTRAWLAMAGREILKTFHGGDARQAARTWVGMKFNTSPAQEIQVSLSTIEENHGYSN